MVISHYGLGMVKIQLGERVMVFNPNGHQAKFGADLALVSLHDADYNDVGAASRGERVPFVIEGPGEYEVDGVFIKGFQTTGPSGKINTAYLVVLDSVRLVHLGALAESTLPAATIEAMGTIDILFVPVAGGLLEPKAAAKIATTLEPRAIVPVNYESGSLAAFLKELGEEQVEPVASWSIKKKDLSDKEAQVVIIKSA